MNVDVEHVHEDFDGRTRQCGGPSKKGWQGNYVSISYETDGTVMALI